MLNIHNLSVSFQGEYLFEEITFRLGAGDRVGLIGKNGAGKSTLLKILSKEMEPDTGQIASDKDRISEAGYRFRGRPNRAGGILSGL